MKSRQLWITAGTAVVSFALGATLAPSLKKSGAPPPSEIPITKSSARSSSESQLPNPGDGTARTRLGNREDKKKNAEPRVSIPLSVMAKALKDLQFDSNVMASFNGIDRTLALLGTTDTEGAEIRNSLERAKVDLQAAEKKLIKVIQTDQTEIKMDNSAMRDLAASASRQVQADIRSSLPTDTAELLISSINWEQFYPTNEENFPTLSIIRQTSSRITAMEMIGGGGHGGQIHGFPDDGTPIPADQIFDDRWKPLLKGLTLLPQNEK